MSATFVVLHTKGLAAGAPDPRDRQLLRRVVALASVAEVTLVCSEPQLGPRRCDELAAAGVSVIEAAARVDAVLAECSPSTVVIATNLTLGAQVQRVRPELALVVDLASPDGLDDVDDVDADPLEHAGLGTLREHERARARAVLEHASVVLASSTELADVLTGRAPGAQVVVAEPAVPIASSRVAPGGAQVAVVGEVTAVRGWTTERALVALLDDPVATDVHVSVVGVDASVLRRALAAAVPVTRPRDVVLATRELRAAVVVAGADACAAELLGAGVPVVTIADPDDIATVAQQLVELVHDDDAWALANRRALELAATRHAPEGSNERYLAALRSAQLLDAPDAATPRGSARPPALTSDGRSSWEPRPFGGSLAAQTSASEQLRREAQPAALLPWTHALYTNLDLAPDVAYRRWLGVHHDVDARRAVLTAKAQRMVAAPLISVVMPVHDTDPVMLRAAIESVRSQLWTRWQLCIADDGSTDARTRGVLRDVHGDERIRIVRSPEAEGIAAATNRAIAQARGDYVAFLDHDDVLVDDALYWIARAIDLDPRADIVYSDEDKLDEHGRRVEPFCKPDWSPDLLLSCNYITHLLVVRRSLLERVGGLRPEVDGAQDYDLLLRLTELTDQVVHVPKPLYSWRKSPASTAADIDAKPHAHAASRRTIVEALARRGIDATREAGIDPTWHRVRHRIGHRPTVTVIIPTRDRVELLQPCVELLGRGVRHRPLELLVVDNDSRDPATLDYLARLEGRVVRYPHQFNYARQMNLAALEAQGEVLLLLNNDARPIGTGWFDAMLEHALRPEIGAVGARLRFPDGRAQHEGVVLNAGGVALNLDAGPYAVLADNVRDVAAVTGACLMVRRSVWDAVGGMDERLRVAYNDVDLCLRIGERGWRNLYTPLAELTHQESSSRGSLHPEVDEEYYQRRWGTPQTCADPFFTTALELLAPFSPRL